METSILMYNKTSRRSAGNTTAALTTTLAVKEQSIMADSQSNCAHAASQTAEEWRVIRGRQGRYEASSLGRIRSAIPFRNRPAGWRGR